MMKILFQLLAFHLRIKDESMRTKLPNTVFQNLTLFYEVFNGFLLCFPTKAEINSTSHLKVICMNFTLNSFCLGTIQEFSQCSFNV